MGDVGKVGIIMLVHTALDRAERIAHVWADAGCPVVMHLDKKNSDADYDLLTRNLADHGNISFCKRHPCDWGSWELVQATQEAAQQLLSKTPIYPTFFCHLGRACHFVPFQS